jgi:hypothetical protein
MNSALHSISSNISQKFHTKSTKEEKITKKREYGVFVRNLCVGLHDKITDKNPTPYSLLPIPSSLPLCSAHCRQPKGRLAFNLNSGICWCYAMRYYSSIRQGRPLCGQFKECVYLANVTNLLVKVHAQISYIAHCSLLTIHCITQTALSMTY